MTPFSSRPSWTSPASSRLQAEVERFVNQAALRPSQLNFGSTVVPPGLRSGTRLPPAARGEAITLATVFCPDWRRRSRPSPRESRSRRLHYRCRTCLFSKSRMSRRFHVTCCIFGGRRRCSAASGGGRGGYRSRGVKTSEAFFPLSSSRSGTRRLCWTGIVDVQIVDVTIL